MTPDTHNTYGNIGSFFLDVLGEDLDAATDLTRHCPVGCRHSHNDNACHSHTRQHLTCKMHTKHAPVVTHAMDAHTDRHKSRARRMHGCQVVLQAVHARHVQAHEPDEVALDSARS